MKKVCLISAYFGKFPDNIQYFLESVKYNSTIDFVCYSDISVDALNYILPENFHIVNISFSDFNDLLENGLHIKYRLKKIYKICDFRPFWGVIFENELKEYDVWGFHDFDMVFGDIRKFITDDILEHNDRVLINGHLSLFKNDSRINHVCLEGSSKQNLNDVISNDETIAYDEMSGMRLAFEERGLTQYVNPAIWVDIVESIEHVVNNNRYNKTKQFCVWDDGKLWWCIKKGKQVVKLRELIYVHFQKRKMRCDSFKQKKAFYIYNREICYTIPKSDLTTAWDIANFYLQKITKKLSRKFSK